MTATPIAMGTLGNATAAGMNAPPSTAPGTSDTITNPPTTAPTTSTSAALIQRSCWRSIPVAARVRTTSEATATATSPTMNTKLIDVNCQIGSSGATAIGLGT